MNPPYEIAVARSAIVFNAIPRAIKNRRRCGASRTRSATQPMGPKGCLEFQDVGHQCVVAAGFEQVIVFQKPKCAASHSVLEKHVRMKLGDLARERLSDAEVLALPGHVVAEFEEPGQSAADDALAGACCRLNMCLDAAGKVETRFNRCANRSCYSKLGAYDAATGRCFRLCSPHDQDHSFAFD